MNDSDNDLLQRAYRSAKVEDPVAGCRGLFTGLLITIAIVILIIILWRNIP